MKNIPLFVFFVLAALMGCEDDPNLNPDGFTEFIVDIDGTWKVEQVLQNGVDVTSLLDFTTFSLQMDYDNGRPGSFVMSDLTVPFVLGQANGTWSFDDPVYPTAINFSDGTTLALEGSVLSGGGQMTLTVPLGCGSNTYSYRLSK